MNVDGVPINFAIKYDMNNKKTYFQHILVNKLSFLEVKDLKKVDYGKKPQNSNELVISSYLADLMIEFGVMNENKEYYFPKDYNELINDEELLILGPNPIKIVGIYDLDFTKYDVLKKKL